MMEFARERSHCHVRARKDAVGGPRSAGSLVRREWRKSEEGGGVRHAHSFAESLKMLKILPPLQRFPFHFFWQQGILYYAALRLQCAISPFYMKTVLLHKCSGVIFEQCRISANYSYIESI